MDEAELAGYSGVFATENRHEPILPLAAAANRSRRIKLGTGVIVLLARNPFHVAQFSWDLHYNSGENFILGIGTPGDPHLGGRLGLPVKDKYERVVEAVAVVRELWACWMEHRSPDYHGRHYEIHACPEGYRPTTKLTTLPRIFYLCSTMDDLRIAPAIADGIFIHPTWVPGYVDRVVRPRIPDMRNGSPFQVIDGGIISTGITDEELCSSRAQARARTAYYWQKAEYDYVYAELGLLPSIERFRRERSAGVLDWNSSYAEDLYRTFVCEALTADLPAQLERRCSRLVTGVFPNIVSEIKRLMPAEIVAGIRAVKPGGCDVIGR